MENLIQELIIFRQENSLTKKELAKKIGVKENDIICWENKLSFPSDEEIILIENFFDKVSSENISRNSTLRYGTITYGHILKDSRNKLNLTREEFATNLNITVDRLVMWEEDIVEPDEDEENLINSYLETEIFKKESKQNKRKKSSDLNEFEKNSPGYEIIGKKHNGSGSSCVFFSVLLFLASIALFCYGILFLHAHFGIIILGVFFGLFGTGLFIFGIHLIKLPKNLIGVSDHAIIFIDRQIVIKFTDIDTILSREAHSRYATYDYGEVIIITKSGESYIQGYIENVEKIVSYLNKKLRNAVVKLKSR